jgi:hypothetical protein
MDPLSSSAACDAIMDEWGKCIIKEEDTMSISTDGVLDGIRQNNPAITAVEVDCVDYYDANIDWAAAGNGIGSNRYLRFLCVRADGLMDLQLTPKFKIPVQKRPLLHKLKVFMCVLCFITYYRQLFHILFFSMDGR